MMLKHWVQLTELEYLNPVHGHMRENKTRIKHVDSKIKLKCCKHHEDITDSYMDIRAAVLYELMNIYTLYHTYLYVVEVVWLFYHQCLQVYPF